MDNWIEPPEKCLRLNHVYGSSDLVNSLCPCHRFVPGYQFGQGDVQGLCLSQTMWQRFEARGRSLSRFLRCVRQQSPRRATDPPFSAIVDTCSDGRQRYLVSHSMDFVSRKNIGMQYHTSSVADVQHEATCNNKRAPRRRSTNDPKECNFIGQEDQV